MLGDVLVRVDVIAGDAASAPVVGVERDPPHPQLVAELPVAVLAEVGDHVAFLLRQVLVVRLATGQDRLPPRVAPRVGAGGGPDRVADLVVVTDRVVGLPGRLAAAAPQEDGIEDLLLRARVNLEQVGERPPSGGDGIGVARGAKVPQRDEVAAELLVLVEDQVGDVGVAPRCSRSPVSRPGTPDAVAGRVPW